MEAKQVGWGQQGQRSQHPGPRRQLPPPQPLRLVSRSQKYSLGCEVSAALSSRKEFKVFKRPAGEAPRPQRGRKMEPILVSVLAPGPGDDESAKGLSPNRGPADRHTHLHLQPKNNPGCVPLALGPSWLPLPLR